MDIQAMQSMDWLFKKERIYLLAQFWQQRATLAEKEVSALKEQLATANQNLQLIEGKGGGGNKPPGGGGGGDMDQNTMDIISRSGLEVELAAKEKEISQLVEDVQRLQSSITKLQETSAGQIARLEEQLDHKRQHIARLEARLDAQRDYDDVKRELSILRNIEFPSMGPGGEGSGKSLEMILLERTKALQQAENAALKAAASAGADLQDTQQTSPATPNSTSQQQSSEAENKPSSGNALEGPSSPHNSPPSSAPPSFTSASSPTSLSLVNSTTAISSPLAATTMTTTTSSLGDNGVSLHHHLMNGNPKTPPEDASSSTSTASALCNNNTINHSASGAHLLSSVSSSNNINNNVIPPPPTSTPVSVAAGLSFFRNDDSLKSPFRFDDPRSPFRFSEDGGPMTPSGVMVGRLGESLIPKGDPMEAKLQEMLRYNMDKYSTQNLDTLHISRRVRELLSINNIGQRLFAKYVLGLSQGTVSELLSKPKPWDKLTEKGRDSYRKMHAWACDDNAVLLLKSLIPKKGKDTGIPAFARGDSDNMTEERIAHILSEASQMMKTQVVEDSHSNDSKSPNQGQHDSMLEDGLKRLAIRRQGMEGYYPSRFFQCPSPLGKDNSQNRRLKKYENDDIPQEKVVRIYQEELAKLMGRRMEDSIRGPREHFPSGGGGGGPMDRTQEEIRMALDAYHRELAKLNSVSSCPTVGSPAGLPGLPGLLALQQQALSQQQQQHAQLNGVVQDLSLPKDRKDSGKLSNGSGNDMLMEGGDSKKEASMMESVADVLRHAGSAFSLVRPKTEPGVGPGSGAPQSTTGSSASSPLSNSILPPAMTPGEDFSSSAAAASPLQRMASITNSLISQPSTPTHHSPSQRPLKAVLPPITQQQFDMFNNLNTEDIVKKVKESLSQYSISQRLFGESVLGLSQGSVSDLLARPKPWHMLTQKGREPFIRMKMFLEDDNAVHKLVASQYKIAPEKLMRTGNYAGGPPCSSLSKPPSSKLSDSLSNKSMSGDSQGPILPPSLQLIPPHPQQPPSVPQPPPPPLMVTPPGHHSIGSLSSSDLKKSQQNHSPHPNLHPSPHHHQQQSSALRALQQHMTPSVYEMAALTQDLDTQVITTKIKEALLANNIGQKIFGEAVLGLSQGSVSELLSKPKPWHMLSIKGREPFIRMQLWLSDAHNIDRLQALKNERREANKRRRSSGPGGGMGGGGGGADNSSDTSSNDTSEFYHSPSPGPGPPSAKKQRVLFSEEQKEALRLAFALDSYPNVATIEFLSSELALSSRTITNWFHNHRMRLKQQVPHGIPDGAGILPPPRSNDPSNGGQQSFDPVQFRLLLNQRLLELQKERMGLGSVPLPYPPYFAANANLAALIGRGLLPTPDCDPKEQFSGLDLSMGGLKREPADYEDEEDAESNMGSEDSNLSAASLRESSASATIKKESSVATPPTGRSSRRKPAAPQWVNPEWQEAVATEGGKEKPAGNRGEKEVIINGVCVMQGTAADEYGIKLSTNDEETVRVEPTPVLDPYDDRCSEASSDAIPTQPTPTEPDEERVSAKSEPASPQLEDEERMEEAEEAEEEAEGEVTEVEGSVEVRHKFIKEEDDDEEGRGSPTEEDRKEEEWDQASGKRPSLERDAVIDKRIKAEDREERWNY